MSLQTLNNRAETESRMGERRRHLACFSPLLSTRLTWFVVSLSFLYYRYNFFFLGFLYGRCVHVSIERMFSCF